MNTSVKYCLDGCPIPLNGTVVDPFSEMNYNGFKGVQYCNLTCASDPSMFPGGTLPSQCSDPSLSPYVRETKLCHYICFSMPVENF